jgi:hypothetical protein
MVTNRSFLRRRAIIVVLAASVFTSLAAAVALASISLASNPRGCASLSIDFAPNHVTAGQFMDFDSSLSNCSSTTERLVVVLDPTGPCPFVPESTDRYSLGPQEGFGTSGLMLAPSCPGHYRVKGRVRWMGRVIARDVAGFTVLPGA